MGDLYEEMRQYYARRAPEYDDWYDRSGRYDDPATNALWHGEVAALGHLAADYGSGRLLDVACGTGRWTERFAANPHVTEVTALDGAAEMLAQTRARLAGAGCRATLVQGDAYAMPFADASFDCAFSGFFLSHVPPERVGAWLVEVRRVVRPGGAVLIFDSLLPDGREEVQVQHRPLKDGSRHRVLKVYYTPATLTKALAPIAARGSTVCATTGRYFIHARLTTRG